MNIDLQNAFEAKWSVPERYDVALCCNDTSFDISQTGDKKDIIPDEWKIRLALYDFVLLQVSTNCHLLPKYVAIAQFHNGRVTSKTGVFLVCTQSDGFEVDNVNKLLI